MVDDFTKNLNKRVPDDTLRTWNYEANCKSPVFGTLKESEVDVWRSRWIWLYQEMQRQIRKLEYEVPFCPMEEKKQMIERLFTNVRWETDDHGKVICYTGEKE